MDTGRLTALPFSALASARLSAIISYYYYYQYSISWGQPY